MSAYAPIAGLSPQYEDQSGWWLKFYSPTTSTPIVISIDSTGTTTIDKSQLDIDGFPTTDGTTIIIPFLGERYHGYLFPTAAEANANNTANAFRVANNINPFGDAFDLDIEKLTISVVSGQTSITVPDAPTTLNLIVDGSVYEETNGDYNYSAGTISGLVPFAGGENVEVQYGLIAPVTGISISGIAEFDSVAQMVASPDLLLGDKVVTYLFNSVALCNWVIVAANTGDGDMSDGTINLTGSSLQAKLQVQSPMTLEQWGAFGDSINDDKLFVNGAFSSGAKIYGNSDATYLVTGQLPTPNGTYFDGLGCKFDWNGTAGAITFEGRDWGVFSAMGSIDSTIDTKTLSVDIPEFEEDAYPTSNDAAFTGYEDKYIFVFAGSTGSSPELPSFSLMPKFAGLSGANQARLDYRCGWDIPAGQSITYKAVTPVNGIILKNFTITDKSPTSAITANYASAISFAFAYNCHTENITGVGFRNPIMFNQYCTDCTSKGGRVEKPQETGGGQGYHTQWSYSLRCNTEKLTGYLARHICDHTKSAYCNVLDCGDTNTADGAFTNHGSYEHDISYTNCIGWHSVANSGAAFGDSAKRINITNGNGVSLTAGKNVIDLSVTKSTFGRVLANSQGFQADGLTVGDDGTTSTGFSLTSFTTAQGRTTLSKRDNVISNSSLAFNSGQVLCDFSFTGRTVYLNNTKLRKINSSIIGTGAVRMDGGSITGTTSAIELGADASISLNNTDTDSFGVRHNDGVNNSYYTIDGGLHTNIITTGIYSNRMLSGKATVSIDNVEIDGGTGIIIDMPNVAGTNEMFMDFSHNTFSNGSIFIANNYSGSGKLFYTNNLEVSVTRTTDVTGGRRIIENNITA